MTQEPETAARTEIDRLLTSAGWDVQDVRQAKIQAAHGVASRGFSPKFGCGRADYMGCGSSKSWDVIGANTQGLTLAGVETQSAKYVIGLLDSRSASTRPPPFSHGLTGVEARFIIGLDLEPRSRNTVSLHKPRT